MLGRDLCGFGSCELLFVISVSLSECQNLFNPRIKIDSEENTFTKKSVVEMVKK